MSLENSSEQTVIIFSMSTIIIRKQLYQALILGVIYFYIRFLLTSPDTMLGKKSSLHALKIR